jgi:penicillin amidase
MRIIKGIALALLILLLIIGGAFLYLRSVHAPSTANEVALTGLQSNTIVNLDEFGIPHIYAENNVDAWRTMGYIHARDRLFQMDVLRRVGSGRLAELFGDDVMNIDRLFRTMGTAEISRSSYETYMTNQTEEWQILAQAYVDGINDYRVSNHKPIEYTLLGLEPEPFETVDIYHVVAYMSFSFAMALKTDPLADKILKQLGAEYMESLTLHTEDWHPKMPVYNVDSTLKDSPGFDSIGIASIASTVNDILNSFQLPLFEGSNSWVLAPKKSKSGKVLFANDTHINYAQPSVWYEAHIETPTTRLYGNFLAGFPFPIIGHTTERAWGLTMFENDDMDLYREAVNGDKYLHQGVEKDLIPRKERIVSSSGKEATFTVNSTVHGPIINAVLADSTLTDSISCFWTLNQFPIKFLQVTYQFFNANSLEEFKSALPDIAAPGLNVMYGDADGNYGWWATAKIIKRPAHVDPKTILNGSSGEDDILGYYHFDENPQAVNTAAGFVHSANNAPAATNGSVVYGYYYAGQRSLKISEELAKVEKWDLEMMQDLALNDQSPWYPKNALIMTKNVKANTAYQQEVLSALQSWDGKHGLAEKASMIYYQMLYYTLKFSMEDELGKKDFDAFMHTLFYLRSVSKFLQTENNPWWDDRSTDAIETKADILQKAFEVATDSLAEALGTDVTKWQWQKVHQITHPHPMGAVPVLGKLLNVGPLPVAGGEEVINKQAFWLDNGVNYPVKSGPAMRILIDFADIENSLSVLPTGQSGNPFSKHYDDQAQLFVDGKWRKQRMNKADIEQHTALKITFKPSLQ